MAWRYETDENPKRRHHWDRPEHGFVDGPGGERIGKCPRDVSAAEAEAALADGLPWSPDRWGHPWPKRIYMIHRGTLYRAHPTNPGVSYHAFPEDPAYPGHVPKAIRDKLRAIAEQRGLERELKPWL